MENSGINTAPINTPIVEKQKFKETGTYYLTRFLLITIMALFISFLFYKYAIAFAKVKYPLASVFMGLRMPQRLFDFLRCLLVVGFGIWGLITLEHTAKAVLIPLFCLAGLLAADAVSAANNFLLNLKFQYTPTLLYNVLMPVLLIVPLIFAIVSVLKYNNGMTAAAPAVTRKDVSGIGGWMILSTIRCFGMTLSNLFSFGFMILVYLRAARPKLPAQYFNMELGLFYAWPVVLGIITLINLFKKKYQFKYSAIMMELVNIIVGCLGILYMVTVMAGIVQKSGYLKGTFILEIVMLGVSVAFAIYYAVSDRVANTFKHNGSTL